MKNEKIYDYVEIEKENINPKLQKCVEAIIDERLKGKTLVVYAVNDTLPSFILDIAKKEKDDIYYKVYNMRKLKPKEYFESVKTFWNNVEGTSFDNYVLTSIREEDNYEFDIVTINSKEEDVMLHIGYHKEKYEKVDERHVNKKLNNKMKRKY